MSAITFQKKVLAVAVLAGSVIFPSSAIALDESEVDLIKKINATYKTDYFGMQPPAVEGMVEEAAEPAEDIESFLPYDTEGMYEVSIFDDPDMSANLTREEIESINNKRRALVRYLYEEERLKDLRVKMDQNQRSQEYQSAIIDKYPFSPQEIMENRKLAVEIDRATNSPLVQNVQSRIRTTSIDLESSEPIHLAVAPGYASSMVFYDDAGRPWPIVGDVIGNGAAFKSTTTGESKHIAVFEIMKNFTQSNALINLEGLPVPLVIHLTGTSSVVDSRLSIRIPRIGPATEEALSSNPAIIQSGGSTGNAGTAPSEMMEMLNGGKLKGGKKYSLEGVDGSAYLKGGKLYLRTKAKLISPPINAPISMELQSPTGYNVYKIPPSTHLIFSDEGERVDAEVKESVDIERKKQRSIFNKRGS